MARSTARHKPMSEINMVPFIDIMMVLLVAFMVSAPMLTQGVKVDLPKVTSKPIPVADSQKNLIISIQANGDYFLDLGKQHDQATSLNVIQEKVSKIVAAQPEMQVLIKGDTNVVYGVVIELMALLQGAGVENVGLITSPTALNEK
ncbi:MAG: protein TolR [Candidatus Endonucleobacter bathymodioli]|uniref:Tol-Pal system protein TolR n=1 Tax=Candidatus Endonucleibacter bathymodioli TaxID=539814 RepID=A0AA90NXH2_9GAMM|nr:protein TolR [Candidatus Endonucleobacter bathymodioli]